MRATIIPLLLCILLSHFAVNAQDNGRISYFPVVIGADIPEKAKQSLTTKMEQILTKNDFGSVCRADRFVMLAKCNILEKDVAPTTPPRITQTIEVTFILGDVIENKIYASASLELKGIGTNETKAWQTAFAKLKPADSKLVNMFETASEKIESYYSESCKKITADAKTYAAIGNYDRAIHLLMSVPDVCAECRNEALTEAITIYQQKIDAEGADLLAKARNVWAKSPDTEGADAAMEYINCIPTTSASFAHAEELVRNISDKISSDNEREWQQRLREYNDEKEFRLREQHNSHTRSMATIAACRSVAEKWTENQPQTKVYLNW